MSDVPGPFMLQELGALMSIPQVLLMLTVFEGNDGSLVCGCQAVEEVLPQGLPQEILDAYAHLLHHLADEGVNWNAPDREMILPPESPPRAAIASAEGETVTGLRGGLLAPQESQQQHRPDRTFVAPRDLLERQLATLWEELLGIQHIGITDNFFELGGTSLLVIHLVNRLQAMSQQLLVLSTFFQNDLTIEHLANTLRQQAASRP